MKEYVLEKSKEEDKFKNYNENQKYFRFIGIINHSINKIVNDFFPSYKNCAFEVSFSANNGEEIYSLNCFYNFNIYGRQSKNLYHDYEFIKNEIDIGNIG
tara:strand:- start:2094 stop:2393 length:300 start_codon:yes stop_codon:yes gene_type:complete